MSQWTYIFVAVCGTLSIISTTALILLYALKKSSRTYGFRLVIQLFVYDLIFSASTTIPTIYGMADSEIEINIWLCRFEGALKLSSMLASFFTTVMISWTLYSFIVLGKPIKTKNPSLHFLKYTALLPFLMTLLPLTLDRIGQVSPLKNVMCFICLKEENGETDYTGVFLRIFVYYLPFIIVLIFDVYSAVRIIYYFRKNKINYTDQNDVKYLILYPIILLFSWVWIITARIAESISSVSLVWLNDFDSAFAALNGFLNALVYGFFSLDPFGFFHKKSISSVESSEKSLLSQQFEEDTYNTDGLIGSKTGAQSNNQGLMFIYSSQDSVPLNFQNDNN